MQIIRRQDAWNPLRELDALSSRFHRLLSLSPLLGNGESEELALTDWAPSCDISESEKEYRIRAELPDVKKEDVHVQLNEGMLTLRGERRQESAEEGQKFHRREMSYGSFERRFSMPRDVNDSKIDAKFKDGILTITLAKANGASSKVREISVRS